VFNVIFRPLYAMPWDPMQLDLFKQVGSSSNAFDVYLGVDHLESWLEH
jgi:hypothetical protein